MSSLLSVRVISLMCCWIDTNNKLDAQGRSMWRNNETFYDSVHNVIKNLMIKLFDKRSPFFGELEEIAKCGVDFDDDDDLQRLTPANWNYILLVNCMRDYVKTDGDIEKAGQKLKRFATNYEEFIDNAVDDIKKYINQLYLFEYISAIASNHLTEYNIQRRIRGLGSAILLELIGESDGNDTQTLLTLSKDIASARKEEHFNYYALRGVLKTTIPNLTDRQCDWMWWHFDITKSFLENPKNLKDILPSFCEMEFKYTHLRELLLNLKDDLAKLNRNTAEVNTPSQLIDLCDTISTTANVLMGKVAFNDEAIETLEQHLERIKKFMESNNIKGVEYYPKNQKNTYGEQIIKMREQIRDNLAKRLANIFDCISDSLRDAMKGMTKILLDYGADINSYYIGETPLQQAVRKDNLAIVDCLVELGADVNATNKRGEPPLYKAAHNGNLSMVEYLISHGADVNKGTENAGFLCEHSSPLYAVTPLHIASQDGHLDIVKYLLANGASKNATDSFGRTALYRASIGGHIEIVEYLLEHEASIDAADDDGRTPLFEATRLGHRQIVELLVNRGANVNRYTAGHCEFPNQNPLTRLIFNSEYFKNRKEDYKEMIKILYKNGSKKPEWCIIDTKAWETRIQYQEE